MYGLCRVRIGTVQELSWQRRNSHFTKRRKNFYLTRFNSGIAGINLLFSLRKVGIGDEIRIYVFMLYVYMRIFTFPVQVLN